MNWTVSRPREVAEDDHLSVDVEADSLEDAIEAASQLLYGSQPYSGMVFNASVRVQVMPRPRIPLKSI